MTPFSNKDAEQIRELLAQSGQSAAQVASVLNGLTPELIELLNTAQHKLNEVKAENEKLSAALEKANKKVERYESDLSYGQVRLTDAIETLMALATLDFDKQAKVTDNADEYDGLATGLNMLGQELKSSTVSVNFLEDILNSMSEALIVVDETGKIDGANPAALHVFGNSIAGSHVQNIISDNQKAFDLFSSSNLKALIDEARLDNTEMNIINSDKKPISLEVILSPMKSKKGVLIIARDITERREAELRQQLLVTNLEKSNSELRQFAYVASHDLKAPLRAISMLAQWVMDDSAESLTEDSKSNLDMLITRAQRMYSFLDSMLAYSRIGVNQEQLTEINLNKLVKEVIGALAVPDHIQIHIDKELPVVKAAEVHMIQVFQNLISNAIRYMDKDQGQINIGFTLKDDEKQFYVRDNGPGIEKEYFVLVIGIMINISEHGLALADSYK